VKAGVRALGVADSYRGERSILAGAVVTAARVVDGFSFASCTVGGLDATEGVRTMVRDLDREDVQYLFLSGIAPAWFNVYDLQELADALELPVLSISFEASEGLSDAIAEAFDGETRQRRLERYESQPTRHPVDVNDERVYVRSVGLAEEDPTTVVRAFTSVGGRPEPLRVARLAARGVDRFRHREGPAAWSTASGTDPGA